MAPLSQEWAIYRRCAILDIEKAIWCRDANINLKMVLPGFQGDRFNFQTKDIAYLFFIKKALLANQTGLGKTAEIIALNCLQKHHRALEAHIQVVPAQSLVQWAKEYKRFAPHLIVRVAWGRPVDRMAIYNSPCDVLLVSYHTLWNDWEYIASLHYNSIGLDEASFFKSPSTKTFDIVRTLCKPAEWVIPITATPIQNCVTDLWSIYQCLNMPGLLGGQIYFQNRYCIVETQTIYSRGKRYKQDKITGYRNLDELKARISPFYVRRRVVDPEVGQDLPALMHDVKWLELLPAQRDAYDQAKNEILVKGYRGRELRSRFHTLKKIIDGMKTLDQDHGEDVSVKSDKIMELLSGDLAEDKCVIFSWYKANLYCLSERLKARGIIHDFITGDERDKLVRYGVQERFARDPSLRVILGTTALEMSLNLQAAKFMIFYDSLYNPARNLQVIGRIRRIGSEHGTCVAVSLVCKDTLEERMMDVLTRRAAVSDYVFGENVGSDVYDKLTDDELLHLIKG